MVSTEREFVRQEQKGMARLMHEIGRNPLGLMSKKEWIELLDRIAIETKMSVILTDDKGYHILHAHGERCPLCLKIREQKEALTYICSQCNTAMLAEARQALRPVIDYCDAGLSRMVVPVVRDSVLVGQVTACGGSPEEEEIDLFLIAKQVGISEQEVETLAASTPVVYEDKIEEIASRTFTELNPQRHARK